MESDLDSITQKSVVNFFPRVVNIWTPFIVIYIYHIFPFFSFTFRTSNHTEINSDLIVRKEWGKNFFHATGKRILSLCFYSPFPETRKILTRLSFSPEVSSSQDGNHGARVNKTELPRRNRLFRWFEGFYISDKTQRLLQSGVGWR